MACKHNPFNAPYASTCTFLLSIYIYILCFSWKVVGWKPSRGRLLLQQNYHWIIGVIIIRSFHHYTDIIYYIHETDNCNSMLNTMKNRVTCYIYNINVIHVYNKSYIDFGHRSICIDIWFDQNILTELLRSISLDKKIYHCILTDGQSQYLINIINIMSDHLEMAAIFW